MIVEILKFIFYSVLLVLVSKYILVKLLRKLGESLDLAPKTIGDITGYATSVPELLTVIVSSSSGLIATGIVNILFSNIINFVQYIISIYVNNNKKVLKKTAIKMTMILVIITILIPGVLYVFDFKMNLGIVMIFLILFILFKKIDKYIEGRYLKKEFEKLNLEIEKEEKWERGNKQKIVKYIISLICTTIVLYIIGTFLGNTLDTLNLRFNIPELVLGIILGIITSAPEFITFIESQKHYTKNEETKFLGVVEATNNLLTSNMLNLFAIQSIGIIIYVLMF